MPLQVGIIGLPLVGKTTIFNALTSAGAESAAYSKASTKPNIGVARIPDERLEIIHQYIRTNRVVPATIQVLDVAGLVRGSSAGQGLGNKFLAHIRDTDALLHVVRCFESDQVAHVEGSIDPVRDIDTVEMELILADLDQVSASLDKAERAARTGEREAVARADVLRRARAQLDQGRPVRDLNLTPEQNKLIKSMGLLTAKRSLFVANVGEDDIQGQKEPVQRMRQRCAAESAPMVVVCGKLEAEIADLAEADRAEMLQAMGLKEPALAVVARECLRLLGLQTFFTATAVEIRAWTIPVGATAPQAAGAVHSDFERGFIRAEIYRIEDLQQYKSEAEIKHHGKLRVEGKNYVMREGDIAYFLFNV